MGATMTTAEPPITANGIEAGDGSVDDVAPRDAKLAEGARRLSEARRSLLSHPRLLISAAAALMTTGISAIVLGWLGAAHTTFEEEQIPYLISGGLLGVALSIVGALLFFTHWLTVSIKEARHHEAARRQDHRELLEALQALSTALSRGEGPDGRPRSAGTARPVRRAARGS